MRGIEYRMSQGQYLQY
uniref:Uncharacterized protein n=1 Tax=Anguilla anguilla TaxID=7936 RepID=A0A0E9QCS7_ANGAN